MFEWNNSYSVGIDSIDAQHRALFGIAAELHSALTAGKGSVITGQVLDRLVQYTMSHFAHEEHLMRLHDYPDLAAHKAEHDSLTRQVAEFQAKVRAGRASISVPLMHFLGEWLRNHIERCDRKYAPHLRNKAVA